jgi:hypothetical protein
MVNPKEYMRTGHDRCRWHVSGGSTFVVGGLQTVMAHWTESGNSAVANRQWLRAGFQFLAGSWPASRRPIHSAPLVKHLETLRSAFRNRPDTGDLSIGNMTEWPSWTPTAGEHQRLGPLPNFVPGGPQNPMGARAMYLFANGRDTLFRIHGIYQPARIYRFGDFLRLHPADQRASSQAPCSATIKVRQQRQSG